MQADQKILTIQDLIKENNLDALLISSVPLVTYFTNYPNFSIEEREAFLIITPKKNFILTDARYTQAIQKKVKNFDLVEVSSINPTKKILQELSTKLKIKSLGIEEDNITFTEYKLLKQLFKSLKGVNLHKIREIKSSQEIKKIQKSCSIGDEAFKYILKKIHAGQTEQEVSYLLEDYIKKLGGKSSFDFIVAFGANSSIPHHLTGKDVLKKRSGQFIKLDFGVRYDNYCSDMTRTIFYGHPNKRQLKIYNTVKLAQQKAIEYINLKLKEKNEIIKASDVDKVARDVIIAERFPTIPHSLGHGIGIEVHELPYLSPSSKNVLSAGMVFSIEPGIYLPKFGGVRIEDLFTIKNNKLIQLTSSPQDVYILD